MFVKLIIADESNWTSETFCFSPQFRRIANAHDISSGTNARGGERKFHASRARQQPAGLRPAGKRNLAFSDLNAT